MFRRGHMFALLVGVTLLVHSSVAGAEDARPPVHVEIVLDSSGSMKVNDPARLSTFAAMIFTDLADDDDRIGVQTMRSGNFTLASLARVKGQRERIRDLVRRLPFDGATYCGGPLRSAATELAAARKEEPDARQFVIFLSDGICPADDEAGVRPIGPVAKKLKGDGVKIFSIGLFDEAAMKNADPSLRNADPEKQLRRLATVTGGEYFRAKKAADLPQRFADILGRIVGSQAQDVDVEGGRAADVTLDGYVYDASLIVTGTAQPIRVTSAVSPKGDALSLPTKAPPIADAGDGFYLSAQANAADRRYAVLRIDTPQPGRWTFETDGPRDLRGILIQNYALDPVLEIDEQADRYRQDTSLHPKVWLRDREGERIDDERFLKKVDVTLVCDEPDGKRRTRSMKAEGEGVYSTALELSQEGDYTCRARATMSKGGLNKESRPVSFQSVGLELAKSADQGPIDLGKVKAGTETEPVAVDLSGSELDIDYSLDVALDGMDGFTVAPESVGIGPKSKTPSVSFTVDRDHAGGTEEGTLVLSYGAQTVDVACSAEVVPLTFWEKWGKLILTGFALVGGLLLLFFIVLGFMRPHSFPADARINWGESMERLNKNEVMIRELSGTGSGFYRNAQCVIGGPGAALTVGGTEIAVLEATGPSHVTIRSSSGVQLLRVNKFDPDKTDPVSGNECAMHSGEVFKVGELYLRLR